MRVRWKINIDANHLFTQLNLTPSLTIEENVYFSFHGSVVVVASSSSSSYPFPPPSAGLILEWKRNKSDRLITIKSGSYSQLAWPKSGQFQVEYQLKLDEQRMEDSQPHYFENPNNPGSAIDTLLETFLHQNEPRGGTRYRDSRDKIETSKQVDGNNN